MLSIQDNSSKMIANKLFSNISQLSGSNLTNVREMISEFDRSNTTLFNILLPVFGAWVGVVVTFYFGSEQARKAQETLVQALSPEAKLSTIKVEEALSRFQETKKIITATLKDKVIDVRNKLENLSNVLVLDDNGKPFGILYKADLYSQKDIAESNVGAFNGLTLENFITEKELIDHITKRKWEKDKPIKNFATISPENTLLHARERMYGISTTHLDVLCVVVDKDGKPIGIIGFDIINYYLQ
jgi:CBS domain-containing protein